jgi:hypothetical protein
MKITRMNLKAFRMSFANQVKDLEKHYGVKLELGNIRFTENQFSSKLTVTNVGDASTSLAEVKFGTLCKKYGFTKSDYNRTLVVNGKKFKLVGFKPRATRYPCIVENQNGQYKMGTFTVKNGLV